VVAIMRGLVRTSKMMLFCSHGMRKCVPSLMTPSFTPESRSKMTAREPPRTSYMDWLVRLTPMAAGMASR
jgi:hypothetical protein